MYWHVRGVSPVSSWDQEKLFLRQSWFQIKVFTQFAHYSYIQDTVLVISKCLLFNIIPSYSCFSVNVFGSSLWLHFTVMCKCIFVQVQMCVTALQLTGEWKLFPADVFSLPAVCAWSSPTIFSTGKRSVIVTVNNVPPPLLFFTWQL